MYRPFDTENGIPARIYRTPGEIREEMARIVEAINEVSHTLNIRELLMNILTSELKDDPEKLIPELEDTIGEAKEALSRMKELEEELGILREELCEVKCLFGRRN